MARLRLGFLGALLLAVAAFAAQIQPAPAGFGAAVPGAQETAFGPSSPASGHAIGSDLWDETDDDLEASPAASGKAVAPAPLRLIAAGHADACLARPRPRATGPPHL